MKEQAEVRTLKVNRYLVDNDEPCKILSITTSKPGKHGAAKARIDVVGVFTNNKRSVVYSMTDKVFIPMIDKRKAQILSVQGTTVQLMDAETYDTFDMEVPDGMTLEAGGEIPYWEALGRKMLISD